MGGLESEPQHGIYELLPITPVRNSGLDLHIRHAPLLVDREPNEERLPLHGAGPRKGRKKGIPHGGREDDTVASGTGTDLATHSRSLTAPDTAAGSRFGTPFATDPRSRTDGAS